MSKHTRPLPTPSPLFSLFFPKLQSWQKVLIGLCLGIVVGLLWGEKAQCLEPLGVVFLNLIKMITIPLIFFTLVFGVTNIESGTDLRRIGGKAIIVFLTTAMFAVVIGIVSATLFQPGVGTGIEMSRFTSSGASAADGDPAETLSIGGQLIKQLLDIIPTNVIASMAEGRILQVILFAFFTGMALNLSRKQCHHVLTLCREMAQLSFKMIEMIMRLAPIGVFGYMASIVGTQGLDVIWLLGKLVATICVGCLAQYVVFGLLLRILGGISPFPFYRKMIEPQLLAFSTSSSKATLTTLMRVSEERMGVSLQSSRFLLPLSSALNMDGGAIYQGACAVFFAQLFGITLMPEQYLTLVVMCTIASVGGAGIPGGVLLFLGMVLSSVGLPLEAMLLVVSVDRILDMVTTTVNVTGDACVTVLIDASEKTLDREKYHSL